MYKKLKKFIRTRLVTVIKVFNFLNFKIYLLKHEEINLIIGSGKTHFKNWFSTDIETLNVTKESDFKKFFHSKKIDRVLAEHVIEHLTSEEINTMLNNIYKYSSPKINIRIAVPDGFHNDPEYILKVKPGGTGEGASDHKHLFNYKSLQQVAKERNFKVELIEYWDENGEFHSNYKNDEKGYIRRSFLNDARNSNNAPRYTSLIIDLKK